MEIRKNGERVCACVFLLDGGVARAGGWGGAA